MAYLDQKNHLTNEKQWGYCSSITPKYKVALVKYSGPFNDK